MALEGEGSNCFSITQLVGQKGNNKVSKGKLKKYLFGNKTELKKAELISLLDDYYKWSSSSVANQNAGFSPLLSLVILNLSMAICRAMLRVLLKLVIWKISPGFCYCTIFKGFVTGKELQCARARNILRLVVASS